MYSTFNDRQAHRVAFQAVLMLVILCHCSHLSQAELANQIDPLMLQVMAKCQQHNHQVKTCQVTETAGRLGAETPACCVHLPMT